VAPGQDSDRELERQRAAIEDTFRERWVPHQPGEPQILTERACAEAHKTPARGRRAWLSQVIIEAVRDGAQPGDPLPPRRPGTYFDRGTDAEVIIIGRGPGRRVAAEFSHEDFPYARFGHRFEPDPFGGHRQAARLVERIRAGALHQMMDNPPPADSARIIWTTWGTPNSDPELEHQRADIEGAFRHGWRPAGAGQPRVLPLQPRPYIRGVTGTEVIVTGRGPGRCVAVLFAHKDFPGARFGHRFPLEPFAEGHEQIWLMEEIDTGALHRMMRNEPTADDAGIIWTTWGNPDLG
jgi:hypothetical protein